MLGEARRLERLVGDLLDLARLGAQDFRVDARPGRRGRARPRRGDRLGRSVRRGRCAVRPRGARPARSSARTDATRLRQVLDGLFDNALRVTPPGAAIVWPSAPSPNAGRWSRCATAGPGSPTTTSPSPSEQGALHQRYRGVRQVGTGLGLAIVHGLVTRLGGHIEAGHAVEGGARFTVRLPYSS